MESLHQLQTVILLLIAVLALTAVARKLAIPYPLLLVIGGLVVGLIPGLPTIRFHPDLVFLIFLPPILWAAALARLDEVASEDWSVSDHIEQMRVHYGRRAGTLDAQCVPEATEAFRRLRHETLTAERLALIGLRNDGAISDEVLHRLEQELDVEAMQMGIGELRVLPRKRRA